MPNWCDNTMTLRVKRIAVQAYYWEPGWRGGGLRGYFHQGCPEVACGY